MTSTEHADKLVQIITTWLADRDDKQVVAWLIADRLRQYSSVMRPKPKS